MPKPRLTKKVAENLLTLAAYAESEADMIRNDGTEDQRKMAKEVDGACDWIRQLAGWKLSKAKDEK